MEVGKQYILDKGSPIESVITLVDLTPKGLYARVRDENEGEWDVMACRLSEIATPEWTGNKQHSVGYTIEEQPQPNGLTANGGRRDFLKHLGFNTAAAAVAAVVDPTPKKQVILVGEPSHGHSIAVNLAKLKDEGMDVIVVDNINDVHHHAVSIQDVALMEVEKTRQQLMTFSSNVIPYKRYNDLSPYPDVKKRTKPCKRHEYVQSQTEESGAMIKYTHACRHCGKVLNS